MIKNKQNKSFKKQAKNKKIQQEVESIQQRPLKLTQDIVFKNFFSRNKQVLISLLKNFLPISHKITDVVILNPEETDEDNKTTHTNKADSADKKSKASKSISQKPSISKSLEIKTNSLIPERSNKKQAVLDLRVKLQTGENINVEMQTVSQKSFLKRILFYWAKLYCQDLEKGESYDKINPASSLIFTTFPVLDKKIKDFVSSFSIRRDKQPHQALNKDLKIVIVEMSKLTKAYNELLDLKEKWCYILKESEHITKEECRHLSKDEEIRMALKHLKKLSRDEKLYQRAFSEQINLVAYNLDRAGLLEEGMQKGLAQGKLEGKLNKQKEIALNMLEESFEVSTVSKVTGLAEAEIHNLKNKL